MHVHLCHDKQFSAHSVTSNRWIFSFCNQECCHITRCGKILIIKARSMACSWRLYSDDRLLCTCTCLMTRSSQKNLWRHVEQVDFLCPHQGMLTYGQVWTHVDNKSLQHSLQLDISLV